MNHPRCAPLIEQFFLVRVRGAGRCWAPNQDEIARAESDMLSMLGAVTKLAVLFHCSHVGPRDALVYVLQGLLQASRVLIHGLGLARLFQFEK